MEMDKGLVTLEENRQYVIENQECLRKLYGGRYICVVDKNVVDSDKDEFKLVHRIYKKFLDKIVFMSTIEDVVNPKVVALDSQKDVDYGVEFLEYD